MGVPIDEDYRALSESGMSHHEAISMALESGIVDGRILPGSRLPTVRSLSSQLGVSGATVAAAYKVLGKRGWTRGEVGRGTFVVGQPSLTPQESTDNAIPVRYTPQQMAGGRIPWRRRIVLNSAARLRAMYPNALDCTSGKPDPRFFPMEAYKRAHLAAVNALVANDLQYASPEPVPQLAEVLQTRLYRDGISTHGFDMMIGSSAQQLMILSLSIVSSLYGRGSQTVAVEEPGYQTVYDAFEQSGWKLIGMDVDREGVLPHALEAALAQGAQAALFTPRAQNPFGSSWTPTRRSDLARVLRAFPGVLAIEDDQFADLAESHPGSLLNESDAGDRVVYIRSFAKSIAPDLRIALAVAHPPILNLLAEAKSFFDGWSSRLSQRALAQLLMDPELEQALALARERYGHRRNSAKAVLDEQLGAVGGVVGGEDGLNLWIQFGPGIDAGDVLEQAAALGVICTPGEPFYIRPGHNSVLRMSISGIDDTEVVLAAEQLCKARINITTGRASSIPI